jgi:uncharacterized membrane protein YphA (DoxX/SURF4 family)
MEPTLTKKIFSINKCIAMPWVYNILRLTLGVIFIYAGFTKLLDPKAFAKVLSQYDLIPEIFLAPVAIGLPAIEFFAGIGLVMNMRGSLAIIFSLLILFTGVIGYGILNDLNIDCGCFTASEIADQNSLQIALYRDLFMIFTAVYLYVFRKKTIVNSI